MVKCLLKMVLSLEQLISELMEKVDKMEEIQRVLEEDNKCLRL